MALYIREVNCVKINQFVAVTDDPEFCLGTTLLYIDTRNTICLKVIFMCQRKQYNLHYVKIKMDSSLPNYQSSIFITKKLRNELSILNRPKNLNAYFFESHFHFGDSLFVHFQRQESFVIVSQVCLRSLHSGYSYFSPAAVSNSVFSSSKPSQPILHEYVVKQNRFLLCCLFIQSIIVLFI